jgi:hypothetical protein
MTLASIQWRPDRSTLAGFSEVGLFALGMVAAPLAYFRGHPTLAACLWVAAVVVRLVGLARPGWLGPAFVGLSLVTFPIGWVVSNLAMALVYHLVFTPIALAFRLVGRDALKRELDPAAPTYWEPYNPDRGLERYLRPF